MQRTSAVDLNRLTEIIILTGTVKPVWVVLYCVNQYVIKQRVNGPISASKMHDTKDRIEDVSPYFAWDALFTPNIFELRSFSFVI